MSIFTTFSSFKSGSLEDLRDKPGRFAGLFARRDSSASSISSLFSESSATSSDRPSISSLPSYRSQYSYKSSNSSFFFGEDENRVPINALACDGGGVRGASSAKIIAMLMDDLSQATGKEEHAHEYFDMMAGTSTGGLIALMLGRLRIPIDTLLDAYLKLSKRLFKSRVKHFRSILRGSKYCSKLAKKTFEQFVTENSEDGVWTPLNHMSSNSCNVFVTAVNIANASGEPVILRSYDEDQTYTVVESAQATTAAPTYFAAKTLSDGLVAVDGGIRFNNPTELVIKEARRQYGRGVKFGVLLSIGTGEKDPVTMKDSKSPAALLALPGVLADLITDSEAVHQRVHARFEETDLGTYFRINVPFIGEAKLDDYKCIPAIIAATETFMNTPEMIQVRKEIVETLLDSRNRNS